MADWIVDFQCHKNGNKKQAVEILNHSKLCWWTLKEMEAFGQIT